MGSYAQCWLDNLFIGSSKNDIDIDLISLFRAEDKRVKSSPITDLPTQLVHYQEDLNESSDLRVVYYEAPIDIVRDRLDVLGYDLPTAKDAFRAWITEEQTQTQKRIDEWKGKDLEHQDLMLGHYEKTYKILSSLSPDAWIEGLREIRTSGLKTNYYGRYEGTHEDTVIGYMLSNEWYGYPGYDLFVPLRLAIESYENSKKLIYDLTDLVWSGYFDHDEDFIEYGIGISASEYSTKSKTIVLTEGKTDAWILEESLKLLYPHLRDYFSFLDFESTGFGGGVGNLANVVKAFAGAGIVNNIIALFDNDTAAISACKTLDSLKLPPNIVVRRLPELELLKSYPTIGPSGYVNLDVNGVAASIELYLGEDILQIEENKFMPIQWTGYDKFVNKYQGEVLEKAQLQSRFKEKLLRAKNGEQLDWSALRAIFQLLFTSFSDRNHKVICKRASEYYSR